MPLFRRLPKRGFNNNAFRQNFNIVNVGDLERHFDAGATVDASALRDAMPQIDPSNPEALNEALAGAAMFQPEDTPEQKAALARLSPDQVNVGVLAGEPVVSRLTAAPGNGEPLGGIKVSTESGWFAARPSGTEDVYKLYAESFRGPEHLARIQAEAQEILLAVLRYEDGIS